MNNIIYTETNYGEFVVLTFGEGSNTDQNCFTIDEILVKLQTLSELRSEINMAHFLLPERDHILTILSAIKKLFATLGSLAMHRSRLCSETMFVMNELIETHHVACLTLSKCTFLCSPCKLNANSSLTRLTLRIGRTDDNARDWLSHLAANYSLVELTVEDHYCTDDAFTKIINSVNKSSLTKLKLCDITFSDDVTEAMVNLMQVASLTNLALSRCNFINNNFATITESIQKSTISHLFLHKILSGYETAAMCTCIENASISTLKLHGCFLTIPSLILVVRSIKKNEKIKSIRLNNKSTEDAYAEIIADLIKNSNISKINLSNCKLNESDIQKIITAIKCSSILSLKLDDNRNVSASACIAAICDLLENHGLQELCLNGNSIENATLVTMLPTIRKSSLTKFEFESFCPNGGADSPTPETRALIKDAIKEQRKITNRFKSTKGAQKIEN